MELQRQDRELALPEYSDQNWMCLTDAFRAEVKARLLIRYEAALEISDNLKVHDYLTALRFMDLQSYKYYNRERFLQIRKNAI